MVGSELRVIAATPTAPDLPENSDAHVSRSGACHQNVLSRPTFTSMYDTHGISGVLVVLMCQHLDRRGALSGDKPNDEAFISIPTIRYLKNMHPLSLGDTGTTNRRDSTPPPLTLLGEGCPAAL